MTVEGVLRRQERRRPDGQQQHGDDQPRRPRPLAVAGLVAAAIAETGASGMSAMGQVMKTLTPRVAGRADGSRVAAEVRRRLAAG